MSCQLLFNSNLDSSSGNTDIVENVEIGVQRVTSSHDSAIVRNLDGIVESVEIDAVNDERHLGWGFGRKIGSRSDGCRVKKCRKQEKDCNPLKKCNGSKERMEVNLPQTRGCVFA